MALYRPSTEERDLKKIIMSLQAVATSADTATTNIASAAILLNTLTASNTAILSDTTSFTSSYDNYLFIFDNVVPATNAVGFELQIQSGGSFKTTGYINFNATTTYLDLTLAVNLGNTAGLGFSGFTYLMNINSVTAKKFLRGSNVYWTSASALTTSAPAGFWDTGTGAITGVQFLMTSGNISDGTIKIYGFK